MDEKTCLPGYNVRPGLKVIKLFSCSTQLSTKVKLLIKTKLPTNKEVSCFKSLRYSIIMLIDVQMSTIVNIYEQDKFRA